MTDKPVIGLVPLYDDEKDSYWMLPGYMQMLEAAGAVPLMLPLTDDAAVLDYFIGACGGFLLTGGHDVSPVLYHAAPSPACGVCCPARDRMEAYLLDKAVPAGRAVLGICRGLQFLNAHYGGTLYQDLPAEHPSPVDHHMTPPYDRAVHDVTVLPGTPLAEILGQTRIGVNSYHHQAVRTLAPCLRPMAAADDGIVEATWLPAARFVMGVQWHPEFSYLRDENSRALVRAFVRAAGAGTPAQS